MPQRLSPLDVSFLYMEEPTTPMHVGGVVLFEVPESGFDYERLVRERDGKSVAHAVDQRADRLHRTVNRRPQFDPLLVEYQLAGGDATDIEEVID